MLLDFENMEETVIHNFNGGEKDTRAKMYNDENMKILYGVLEPGASIGIHEHTDNHISWQAFRKNLVLNFRLS